MIGHVFRLPATATARVALQWTGGLQIGLEEEEDQRKLEGEQWRQR